MRILPLLFASIGLTGLAGIVGCGERVEKETTIVYVDRYPDASASGPRPDPERGPEHGIPHGEHDGADAGSLDERVRDVGNSSPDATPVPDSSSEGDAGAVSGDRDPPRVEYYNVEQYFGDPREASAALYDASPANADFILTTARDLEELVTVRYEEVAQRGREAELGGTSGHYHARFGNDWDQPGRYWLTIIGRDQRGNEASSDHDILVLDQFVVIMERNLRDAPVYSLDYNTWKAKIVESELFREIFRRDSIHHPGKTDADVVFNYEHTLGRRFAGEREYQKVPIQIHLLRSQDERGALVPVYEFSNEEGGWYVHFAGLVYDDLGVRATGELVEEAMRGE